MSKGTLKYQKIIKVGNSLAMTIDKEFIAQTGIKVGDQVAVNYQPDAKVVSYAPVAESGASLLAEKAVGGYEAKSRLASAVTPELEAWVDNFLKENKEALKRLANL